MALCDDLITKNPLKFVKVPKLLHKPVRVFSEEEMELLIKKSTGQFKNIITLFYFCGFRVSELIALRYNDIDYQNDTIRIDSRIRKGDEDVPKSKKTRVIDMLPQAKKALKSQWELTGKKNDGGCQPYPPKIEVHSLHLFVERSKNPNPNHCGIP